jgi:hypothetical protein
MAGCQIGLAHGCCAIRRSVDHAHLRRKHFRGFNDVSRLRRHASAHTYLKKLESRPNWACA